MKYFIIPINFSEWDGFEKVCKFPFRENFHAVDAMEIGDMLFLHFTTDNNKMSNGIYGNGLITSVPYTRECDGRNVVNVDIKYLRFDKPILNYESYKHLVKTVQCTHRIYDDIMLELMKTDLINIII